jgi:hypothetical protein
MAALACCTCRLLCVVCCVLCVAGRSGQAQKTVWAHVFPAMARGSRLTRQAQRDWPRFQGRYETRTCNRTQSRLRRLNTEGRRAAGRMRDASSVPAAAQCSRYLPCLVTVAGGLVSTHLQRTVPYGAPDPKIAPSS